MGRRLLQCIASMRIGSLLGTGCRAGEQEQLKAETSAGWAKSPRSPVLGGVLGTCFDVFLLEKGNTYRPVVIRNGGLYRMWHTGQVWGKPWIGYATSEDGKSWHREGGKPVFSADEPGEKVAVMCPHLLFDEQAGLYRRWYSGGEQYEPDTIGCATSKDGLVWAKHGDDPVFRPDPVLDGEKDRVTACQFIPRATAT